MDELIEASRKRFRTLAPVEFSPERLLPAGTQLQNLDDLIQAADTADDIFGKQMFPDGDRFSQLEQAGGDEELRDLILFNYGPYDSLDNGAPVLSVRAKLPGMGFYPE